MAGNFRVEIVQFIVERMKAGERVTYGDIEDKFKIIARGQGPTLTTIAERLRRYGHPLLPVMVVNKETDLPSLGAAIYDRLGIIGDEAFRKEQEKCRAYNWDKVFPTPANLS